MCIRDSYVRAHLIRVHQAVQEGINLQGYFVWSLLDNFEWAEGYRPRFGLCRIDFPTSARIPKKSFFWYQNVIQQNGVWE
jgi:beta-glucosidase